MKSNLSLVAIAVAVLLSEAFVDAQRVPDTSLPSAPMDLTSRARLLWGECVPPAQAAPTPASDRDRGFVTLLKRGARDQKEIYTAPVRRRNLKWDALFLAGTGGMIVADKHITSSISHDHLGTSQNISDVGLYSMMGATGLLFVTGKVRNSDRAQETGILGLEAFSNTLAVTAVTQLIAGRERPLQGVGHGRFWVNNTVGSSFPSLHSGLTWSMSSVIAHEYPKSWVQILAYGTATTVSVTRVSGLKHFPADVAVGGVFGYLIGRHIFHSHSRFPARSSGERPPLCLQRKPNEAVDGFGNIQQCS